MMSGESASASRPAIAQRIKPSIAESIFKTQKLSKNVFTTTTSTEEPTTATTTTISPSQSQLPFEMSHSEHQHHHHTMDHSSPTPEPQGMHMNHCSMNMVFNSEPIGTCIVFRQFYVSGTMALLFYLSLLFVIAIGYEYLRLASSRYERMIQVKLSGGVSKRASNLTSPRRVSSNENLIDNSTPNNSDGHNISPKLVGWGQISVPRSVQLTRSLFYVSNVALSFFLMLVVMTYNLQIILAVLIGAFVGHFIFHREITFGQPDKGMACH
ncbi:hypothetical protein MJO29_002878 [Puccinia striiformis f. sp. tritici]|nr:hypothetical protein MJO29_002878 [Puccinia striiformis f. sp. tritici]